MDGTEAVTFGLLGLGVLGLGYLLYSITQDAPLFEDFDLDFMGQDTEDED
jgi:hypothetical protein